MFDIVVVWCRLDGRIVMVIGGLFIIELCLMVLVMCLVCVIILCSWFLMMWCVLMVLLCVLGSV